MLFVQFPAHIGFALVVTDNSPPRDVSSLPCRPPLAGQAARIFVGVCRGPGPPAVGLSFAGVGSGEPSPNSEVIKLMKCAGRS